MEFEHQLVKGRGVKITINTDGQEIARGYLYVLHNDLREQPFGFIEDVFVDENSRGQGIGAKLIQEIIEEAKRQGCYKIIATSRHTNEIAHKFYEKLGFKNHGIEFRINL